MNLRRSIPAVVAVPACLVVAAVAVAAAAHERPEGPAPSAAAAAFDFARPETVASGLQVPWGLALLPDGSALVGERNSGRLTLLRPGATAQPAGTVPGVAAGGEGGLLGLAASPAFATDNLVYAYFTAGVDNRIVRFRLDAPQQQTVVLSGLAKNSYHNGGRIAFGLDGNLYAGVGDAGAGANAQNRESRNGKILRMRPDGGAPADNPFPGSLVYSMGHRNVQGLAWDARGRLYATEFGQNSWDEVNLIVAGGNYGWPTVEGRGNDSRFRDPLVVWPTAEASPSGAAIVGDTLYAAALRGTRLWQVPLDSTAGAVAPVATLVGTYGRLRTVVAAPDGALWITTSNRDGRGTPAAADDRVLRFSPTATPPATSATH